MKKQYILFLFLISISFLCNAQSNYQLGVLPSLNINKKLPRDWSVNFKAESKQSLINDNFNYDYLLTDLSLHTATKIRINTSVAAGYLIRINENNEINHRTIQQISIVKRYLSFNLAHRISADQSFVKDQDTRFRFRYRLSAEIPLEGLSLDPKEFFIKLNNEYLNSIKRKEYNLEIRTAAFLGYKFSSANKFEFGLDYRIDSFINSAVRSRIWISLNMYQSIM